MNVGLTARSWRRLACFVWVGPPCWRSVAGRAAYSYCHRSKGKKAALRRENQNPDMDARRQPADTVAPDNAQADHDMRRHFSPTVETHDGTACSIQAARLRVIQQRARLFK